MNKLTLVWKATLDNIYICEVYRLEPYKGILKLYIKETDTPLMEKEVSLSYDALFGPDAADVFDWQKLCIECVDKQ